MDSLEGIGGGMRCNLCEFLRRFIFRPLCGELMFNREMSIELDRIQIEVEDLRERLSKYEP